MSDSIPAEEEAEKKDNTTSQDTPAAEQTTEQPAEENAEQTEQMENAQNEAEASDEVTPPPAPEPVPVATAPRCENPIIGRKVFFVNPPLYVENYLHLELKLHEYEAYIISDYKYTKNALRKFPDALCFIFIDDELSYDEWFNFIQSFQKDEKLKTIFVGLMSAVIPKPQKERFMMNLSLPGGFIMLDEFKGSALIEKIIGILELNGAKGRRKYLRLDCDPSITINGYFATKTQLLQVTILNISSVGFTCFYPRSYGDALQKKMLVPSFSITLGRRSIVTPSVVFDIKVVDANRLFAIMLFAKQVGEDDKKVIKNFIFEQLEQRFENLIYAIPPDVEDYSNKKPKVVEADQSADSAENIEEAEEVIEEAEEATESNESKDSSEENKESAAENTEEKKAAAEGSEEAKPEAEEASEDSAK